MAARKKATKRKTAKKRATKAKKVNTRVKVKRVSSKGRSTSKRKTTTKRKSTSRKTSAKGKTTTSKRKTASKSRSSSSNKTAAKVKTVVRGAEASSSRMGKVDVSFTKSEMLRTLAERTGLQTKDVRIVMDELSNIIEAHVKRGSAETFTWPGICKMTVKKTPAKKARMGRNPFTGEEMMFKAKPAGRKVKILPLKNLKEMAK